MDDYKFVPGASSRCRLDVTFAASMHVRCINENLARGVIYAIQRLVKRKALLSVLALALNLAACARAPNSTFQGYVEGDYVYMASSQAGQLLKLAVQRGSAVHAGAPLFSLENEDERAAVVQARFQLRSAEALRGDLLRGKRPAEIAVTIAQLQQALASAKQAQEQLNRDRFQYRAGGVSREQLEQSETTAKSDDEHVRELQADLAVDRLPGREDQIVSQADQVQAAKAALAQAEWKLDQTEVNAVQGGFVFDTMYRVGEWVPAGSPVVTILPPGNIKLIFFVPSPVLARIRMNEHLQIRCEECAHAIPGRITFISDQAEYTPTNIYSNDARAKLVYRIEARPIPALGASLHPGQPVEVTLR